MIDLLCLVGGLLLGAICAGAEAAVEAVNPLKLRVVASRSPLARLLLRLTQSPRGFLTTLLVGSVIALLVTVVAGVRLLDAWSVPWPEWVAVLLLTPMAYVLIEMAPKQLVLQHPLRALLRVTPVLAVLRLLTLPLVWPLSLLGYGVLRDPSEGGSGRRHLAALLVEGSHETGGQAPVMQAALRALESEGEGLRSWIRRDLPVLPARTALHQARGVLARSRDTMALLEREGRDPAVLFGTRLVHQAPSVPLESLALGLPVLRADLDLSDALAELRDQGVSFALVGEAGAWEGVFDLEYALSLLLRPDGRTPHV